MTQFADADDSDSGRTATFLVGAAFGAAMALLFTTRRGAEARERLMEMTPEGVRDQVGDAVNRMSKVVDRGVDAYRKAASGPAPS
jgi:gas vesicle protein